MKRRWPIISGSIALGLTMLLGLLLAVREAPARLDQRRLDGLLEERGPWWDVPALLLDWICGHLVGIVIVPLAMVTWLIALRRPWAAGYSLVAAMVFGLGPDRQHRRGGCALGTHR